ncbi:hypothetical protein KEM48_012960 [Puccinia striiformis f. sp. tritici PST-130]|nr:hypothetical protein KEM48_012960 [Puccinia striiformis f. sp. tritici PST-130]
MEKGNRNSIDQTAELSRRLSTSTQAEQQQTELLTTPHAAYVLLAEFDIDTGSGLKHQYPSPTGTAEHVLADLMLPDGAHDRNEDWTVFFLNQTPRLTVTNNCHLENQPQSTPTSLHHHQQQQQQQHQTKTDHKLLYVISLVRTKKDTSVRRGAICKAMAVCSYYPYIQIFKPILLLALEDYFINPSIECLSRLFHAINTMDTGGLPVLTYHERLILRYNNRELIDGPQSTTTATNHNQSNLNLPSTAYSNFYNSPTQPSTATKSSFTDSTPDTPLLPSSSSFISFDTRSVYSNPAHQRSSSGSYSISSSIESPPPKQNHQSFKSNSHSRSTTPPYTSQNSTLNHYRNTSSKRPRDTHFFDTKIQYSGRAIPVRIPLQTFPEEVGEYSLIKLIQTFSSPSALNPNGPFHPHLHSSGIFTHPIVLLFNALITQKRIVFLGHGLPAGHVSEMVLAACALGSGCGGVLEGFISRAFPYCNLTIYEDFKVVPGYIAGVTNPIFELHTDAWDVFCNIETGKITVSKDITIPLSNSSRPFSPAPPERSTTELTTASGAVLGGLPSLGSGISSNGYMKDDNNLLKSSSNPISKSDTAKDSLDNLLMEDILQAIQAHFGEPIIRARMMDYVRRFIRIGSRWEEDQYGTSGIGIRTLTFRLMPPVRSRSDSSNTTTSHLPPPPHLQNMNSNRAQSVINKIKCLGSGAVFVDDEIAYKKEIGLYSSRIEGWRETDSYQILKKKFEVGGETHFGFDISHQISRLRMSRKMTEIEVETIYEVLVNTIETEEQIVEVLSWLPSYLGGLLPLIFQNFKSFQQISLSKISPLSISCTLPTTTTQQQQQQQQQAQQQHLYNQAEEEEDDDDDDEGSSGEDTGGKIEGSELLSNLNKLSFQNNNNNSATTASSSVFPGSSTPSISRHPSIVRARDSSSSSASTNNHHHHSLSGSTITNDNESFLDF